MPVQCSGHCPLGHRVGAGPLGYEQVLPHSQQKHLHPTTPESLDYWEGHQAQCNANYMGSSGNLEANGAMNIWQRSVEKHKLHYANIIADADSPLYLSYYT